MTATVPGATVIPGATGTPVPRVDGPAKVTGRARYSAEHHPAGTVFAAVVDSSVPAGVVTGVDTTAARRAPGVLHVLTHENTERLPYGDVEPRPAVEPVSGERLRVLQDAVVHFAGQPVAVVVADTQAHAEHAATLVQVTYVEHPAPLLDFELARSRPTSDAAAARGRGPLLSRGRPDEELRDAPVAVDGTYLQAREQHHPIEPFCTVAQWDAGRLTVWSKTQWVGNEQATLAAVLGMDPGDVHVVSPFVGGAFGSALRTWPHVVLAAVAARAVGRPVRLELTRRQMATAVGFRPQTMQRVALGAARDGRLLAHVQEAVGQTSTYEEFAEATLDAAQRTYAVEHRRTTYRLVEMHTGTPAPMRGPGHATGLLAQEIAVDELAVALGMDPVELRLRNFAEHDPADGRPWSSNQLRECYRLGAERFGWARRDPRPRATLEGHLLVGLGMAAAINTSPRYPTQASVTVHADGSAVVRTASSDMGPGTYTAATQVAADALRLPVGRVTVLLGDTDFPPAKEHGGSTTLASVGSAVLTVCTTMRDRLDALVSRHRTAPQDLGAVLRASGVRHLTELGGAEPDGASGEHSQYSFGAVFAEVTVDVDLAEIRVRRLLGAYDIGTVVNPRLARSQVLGGMVGGIGMALLEAADWDANLGRVTNANLAEYLVPVCADVLDHDAVFVPGSDPVGNPLGTKGVAELGLCGVAPAVANAVWHATGVRVRKVPILLEALLGAEPD